LLLPVRNGACKRIVARSESLKYRRACIIGVDMGLYYGRCNIGRDYADGGGRATHRRDDNLCETKERTSVSARDLV
jgi:hypothetical protein